MLLRLDGHGQATARGHFRAAADRLGAVSPAPEAAFDTVLAMRLRFIALFLTPATRVATSFRSSSEVALPLFRIGGFTRVITRTKLTIFVIICIRILFR
jgi:hypothetical protein